MIAKIVNNIMRLVLVGYASCSPEIMLYIPAVNPTNTKVANNIILSVFNVSQCKITARLCQVVTQEIKVAKNVKILRLYSPKYCIFVVA